MTEREALKLALKALESFVQPDSCEHGYWWKDCPNDNCEKVNDMKAIAAIEEVLAQPERSDQEQEPLTDEHWKELYEQLKGKVQEFFDDYLNVVEESDSGRIFNPIYVSCSRALKLEPLEKLLLDMQKMSGAKELRRTHDY